MPTHIGIGFSQRLNVQEAAKQAAFEAKTNLRQDKVDLALIFSTIHYPPESTLPVISRILQKCLQIGCSTAGIITSQSVEQRGIAVLTIQSDEIFFSVDAIENVHAMDNQMIGTSIAQKTIQQMGAHPRQAFLFFVDSSLKNTSGMLKGMQNVFGNVFSIIGAGSSDDFHFKDTFQIMNNQALKNSLVGMLMGGNSSVGIGAQHGWRPLGKPRYITEVDGHVIKTIDHKKAVHIYEEYFDEQSESIQTDNIGHMAILYPLGIHVEGTQQYILRNVMEFPPDGSIICQGDLPLGAEVHIMIGNKESCKAAAKDAAEEAKKNLLGKEAKFVIIIECWSRLKLLGRDINEELKQIKEVFGPSVPMIGMFSNGETSPLQTQERFKKAHHQNESIIVIAIS